MRTLGLDPSVRYYGWSLVESPSSSPLLEKGTEKTKSKDFSHEVQGYMHHRTHLRQLIGRLKPDNIVIESPTFNQQWSEGQYTLFMFSMETIQDMEVPCLYLSNSASKAWARRYLDLPSDYEIDKEEMIFASKKHSGEFTVWSSHEADAYVAAVLGGRFWRYLEGDLSGSDLTEYERVKFDGEVYKRGWKEGKIRKKGLVHKKNDRWFKF